MAAASSMRADGGLRASIAWAPGSTAIHSQHGLTR
jgi:hypothetical protein